ncbi:hypothetical protein PoB_002064300 [Plakobranchus ocellatus]|uniref:Uncharacterized protein n=1 Tax=Plakobranchus ocellatus TaxID=259542 RepID=A0AAV3ZHY2_9GAST|nr:hypothetical protein PoB_002064300 [Plakobranchus ocellatus]
MSIFPYGLCVFSMTRTDSVRRKNCSNFRLHYNKCSVLLEYLTPSAVCPAATWSPPEPLPKINRLTVAHPLVLRLRIPC